VISFSVLRARKEKVIPTGWLFSFLFCKVQARTHSSANTGHYLNFRQRRKCKSSPASATRKEKVIPTGMTFLGAILLFCVDPIGQVNAVFVLIGHLDDVLVTGKLLCGEEDGRLVVLGIFNAAKYRLSIAYLNIHVGAAAALKGHGQGAEHKFLLSMTVTEDVTTQAYTDPLRVPSCFFSQPKAKNITIAATMAKSSFLFFIKNLPMILI